MKVDKKQKHEIKFNYYHWGPFLFHTTISKEQCQQLLDVGAKCRKDEKLNYQAKLAGHIRHEYELRPANQIADWLSQYFEAYSIGYNQWRGKGSMKPNFNLTALWINYMGPGEFNPPHDHSADLSFVIYPDVPQEITDECNAFKGTMRGPGGISWYYGEGNRQCISVVNQSPTTGDMFIFPASLKHWVFPFKSKVERVSVSGNVLFDQDSRMNYMGPVETVINSKK